jgi:hypothetical protein
LFEGLDDRRFEVPTGTVLLGFGFVRHGHSLS